MTKAERRFANGVVYTGFDPHHNGNITIEEKHDHIYINKQTNEWTKVLMSITVLTKNNIVNARQYFLHDISPKDYKAIEHGATLYRITEFCEKELAEKVFYSKEDAVNAVVNYLNNK